MTDEFDFVTVDAQQPVDAIQQELRVTIGRYLAGDSMPTRRRPEAVRVKRPRRVAARRRR